MMRALFLALTLAACAPVAEGDAPTPRSLTGTRWVMVLEGAAQHTTPTLVFSEAERASGFTGCNQWFAQVDRSNSGLRFDAMGMTRRACEPAAMDIERAFADSLSQARAAQVEEDVLTLTGENGEQIAAFQRAN
jgi:heat shock protein HslJ